MVSRRFAMFQLIIDVIINLHLHWKYILVETGPNLTIPWWKHLSLSVWSIYIKDRWVARMEETAISILPPSHQSTILLFWETVIVRAAPRWQTAQSHFLRLPPTDVLGRVSPHKTPRRSISSLQRALSDSQFRHWLPLFSLRTPHPPPFPPSYGFDRVQ